jgi:hypothetical protein
MADESEYSNRQLIEILRRGYESKGLDYKGSTPWNENDKKACCEIVKDILGMANTEGGFLVLGVSETPTGYSWDGLSAEQSKTFDTTRLNKFVQNYADPPINARLRKIDQAEKTYVIIEIPQFPDTPHICQKDYPEVLRAGALYVRTDNNETAPIRSSADFRAVVERSVRNRSDSLLTAFRSILQTGLLPRSENAESAAAKFDAQRSDAEARFEELDPLRTAKCSGYFQASFRPEAFETTRFTLDQLRDAAKRGSVDFRGWPFLYMSPNKPDDTYAIQDGLETFVATKDFGGHDLINFWRLQQSGFFCQRAAMRPLSLPVGTDPSRCVLDFREAAVYIAEALHCLTRLYDSLLSDEDQVSLSLMLTGTQDRLLASTWPTTLPLWGDHVSRIPTIVAARTYPLADWRAGMIEHAVEIANEIYLRFNWPNPNLGAARTAIEKTFSRTW